MADLEKLFIKSFLKKIVNCYCESCVIKKGISVQIRECPAESKFEEKSAVSCPCADCLHNYPKTAVPEPTFEPNIECAGPGCVECVIYENLCLKEEVAKNKAENLCLKSKNKKLEEKINVSELRKLIDNLIRKNKELEEKINVSEQIIIPNNNNRELRKAIDNLNRKNIELKKSIAYWKLRGGITLESMGFAKHEYTTLLYSFSAHNASMAAALCENPKTLTKIHENRTVSPYDFQKNLGNPIVIEVYKRRLGIQ